MNQKISQWFRKVFGKKHGGFLKKALPVLLLLMVPLALFLALDFAFPLPFDRLERDYSTLHLTSQGELLRISLSKSGKYRIKAPLEMMPVFVTKGVIGYEDKYFYYHPGINPAAVLRAVFLNAKKKRVVSGASTITLQLAKIIEPKPRNFASKFIEAMRAIQLEVKYSKKEIFEMYLNSIPMGGNIEGIAAASYLYFNKSPDALTPAQAAMLIALPKSPGILKPGRNTQRAINARNEVLDRVFCGSLIPEKTCLSAKMENVPLKRFINPYTNPHLVNRQSISRSFIRVYNLDKAVQAEAEFAAREAVDELRPYKVYNCAVIVVDNKTMNVIAYVGSPDFSDKAHWGEIDGAVILRSPGSALKPFIYAAALDKGLITPKKTIYDIPVKYDTYAPFNFGKEFHGPVKAGDALAWSLNCPAVEMEYELGGSGLLSLMNALAFTGASRKKIEPGLSIALGTYPVTLEELVMLYAGLANGGEVKRLNYTNENEGKKQKGLRIFSPETSYLISAIISEVERPDLPQSWEFTQTRGRVAFKTGTSFGLRDAVCVGYNPDYTVGVWVGNADSSPSFKLIGIKAAAPVVISIFNRLTRYSDSWFARPAKVKTRQVCAASGDVPGEYCKKTMEDYYIEGRTPKKICVIHKAVFTDLKTGITYSKEQLVKNQDEYAMKITEQWPPEVTMYLSKGKNSVINPVYDAPVMGAGYAPKILSPTNNGVYIVNEHMPSDGQKIPLKAAAASGVKEIFWFVNGKAIAESKPGETIFMEPVLGAVKIEIQDSNGAADKINIRIQNRGSKDALD